MNEVRMLKYRNNAGDNGMNLFGPVSYRRSQRLMRRSLSAENTEIFDDATKYIKHAQSFSRMRCGEVPQSLQVMSPIIDEIHIPTDDFCEADDISPCSSENCVFEEGAANHAKDPTKTPMVSFDLMVA
eukprot:TRINITY_DN4063_c0_g1_i9.p5 TRINITY_DN4063_c0_g1~~TRINITY_DN4063_c0_g1_i9.p5  ORF type:complete len:128 (+),score=23.70 TRINITY_DN4063_c0_g1_i9:457-840(+)